ncbi:MAG: outer membrane protein [Nitrospiraceae bacterium]
MATHKSLQCRLTLWSIMLTGCLTFWHTPAYPEGYIAGQLGVTIPGPLSDVDVNDTILAPFDKSSDLDLQTSFLFGAKLGYYSQNVRWFGVEAEVFHTTPHIKQQSQTLTATSLGVSATDTVSGEYLRVITLAGNLMFRYPGRRWQPYFGVGPGIFFARITDPTVSDTQSSTSLGLNTQLGLRYFMTRNVAVFGEYKFNYARFSFAETFNLIGFDATYMAHNFVFGIGYHF